MICAGDKVFSATHLRTDLRYQARTGGMRRMAHVIFRASRNVIGASTLTIELLHSGVGCERHTGTGTGT